MLKHARGTPWLVLLEERCAALGLARIGRAVRLDALSFFTSIEALLNVTTGVSAHDRALTMRVAAGPTATRDDIDTRPCHAHRRAGRRHAPPSVRSRRGAHAHDVDWSGGRRGHLPDTRRPPASPPTPRPRAPTPVNTRCCCLRSTCSTPISATWSCAKGWRGERGMPVGRLDARSYVDVLGAPTLRPDAGDVRSAEEPVLTAIHVQDPLQDLFDDGPDGPRARTAAAIERLAASGIGVLLSLADLGSAGTSGSTRSQLRPRSSAPMSPRQSCAISASITSARSDPCSVAACRPSRRPRPAAARTLT